MEAQRRVERPAFLLGTPFVIHRRNELDKSDVLDAQGRSRFHGAFEGGFSAGYFNTVGSARGWTSSQYVRGAASRTAEDFMDEEDDMLLGDRLRATADFLAPARASGQVALLTFDTSPPASSESASSLANIGKKLLAHCVSKESRRERFLEEETSADRKRAPLMIRSQGLGLQLTEDAHALLRSKDDRYAREWKAKQSGMKLEDVEEDEDRSGRVVSGHEEGLSFYEVEIGDDEPPTDGKTSQPHQSKSDRIKALEAKLRAGIRGKEHRKKSECWPDGIPLPHGCVLAKKHDPNRILLEKQRLSTPAPQNVPAVRDFGSLRPRRVHGKEQVTSFSSNSSTVPLVGLMDRFTRSHGAGSHHYHDVGSENRGFSRAISTWIPNALTLKLFNFEQVVPIDSSGAVKEQNPANNIEQSTLAEMPSSASLAPTIEELRRVFEPTNTLLIEPDFVHSDDESDKDVQQANVDHDLEAFDESSEGSDHQRRRRSTKKHKKHAKKKRRRKVSKRSRRRRSSSSSSSSSSTSSSGSSSDSLFIMDV